MTLEELHKTGRSGVYRADLDQWFIEGEEPPAVEEPIKPVAEIANEPASEPKPTAVAAEKTIKPGKTNDN